MQGEGQAIGGRATEPMSGKLLVATPALKDPNFDRTVVLLVAHEPGGALGVVLNRATEVPVADVLRDWGDLARHPAVLFEGGPVQPDSAICLARMRPPVRRLKGFHQVSGAVGTLDLSVDPQRLRDSVQSIRVFAGYAGWGTGQLEQEVEDGSWFVLDALPGDAFVERPDDLWPMVLRRQGGMMAAVAHFPPDVALN
ncbi:YqgE/AlgH family protein [Micromonospora sp. WMMD1082]|uniref:YqgE/AlgH family protein n=1 Tax=Micromonospora sp. WMMD1082 TaxID=3016104 RepID=UPI002416B59A|nr:YqgE/AlgH family protein [Micromonospora sp. WMMD1082]MDG4793147.1 YqgE/AlgH family protein [Micromonospora sp. WMMD1082]